eukprot:CAMPEP_0185345150 /NCGR_PEP_ID=MMETSP1363-20130426/100480_1 /TAXON_ID=38817 /ORGANISM="Gephyrocapsa oceanica, Strain RCC1303" /LENGTH=311 /DNA_ID=CAMNT_0027944377 /DNA_START=30 /DNA_END=968 /DNA_ORIENTATION=+
MKAPARLFRLSDWYGDDWDHKKPIGDAAWVSPWAKAHFKLRQQEIEIEQCEFLLSAAVEAEDYAEAGGLQTRVERLRSQHPIIPREERLAEALEDGNYELAAIFQQDLDAVKTNLGLPKFVVGQAVEHSHREGLRGVVIDVDLQCSKGAGWVRAAGCLARLRARVPRRRDGGERAQGVELPAVLHRASLPRGDGGRGGGGVRPLALALAERALRLGGQQPRRAARAALPERGRSEARHGPIRAAPPRATPALRRARELAAPRPRVPARAAATVLAAGARQGAGAGEEPRGESVARQQESVFEHGLRAALTR